MLNRSAVGGEAPAGASRPVPFPSPRASSPVGLNPTSSRAVTTRLNRGYAVRSIDANALASRSRRSSRRPYRRRFLGPRAGSPQLMLPHPGRKAADRANASAVAETVTSTYGSSVTRGSSRALQLSTADRLALERIATAASQPYRRVITAQALLLAAEGMRTADIARRCRTTPNSVRRWRSRFAETGIGGVGGIAPGRGRKPSVRHVMADRIAHDTAHVAPPAGAARWTLRSMATRHGVSKDTVARVWRERGLRPPAEARGADSQSAGPPVSAHRETDERDDVIAVLVALNEATGLALSRCRPRDVHRDFLLFMKLIEAVELWVEHWDDPDRPFAWQSREEIVGKAKRARSALTNYTKSATAGHDAYQ